MKLKNNNSRGMTLVEVVVSIALTALVIISLISVVTQSSVFSKSVDVVYGGTYIAQRRLDLLKRIPFDQLQNAEETEIRVGLDGNISTTGYYLRTTEVTENFDGNPYVSKVKISVKRVKVDIDGSIVNKSTGEAAFIGTPIIMETLFSDME